MSNLDTNAICNRGETVSSGRLAKLYGTEKTFPNLHSLTSPVEPTDGRLVTMRFVKNRSGGALLPGMAVKYKTLFSGVGVIKATASSASKIDGFVDCLLPAAGVADGEGFWMAVAGPHQFINDANATVSEFATLIVSPSVAGSVRAQAVVPAVGGDAAINAPVGICEVEALASTTFWGEVRLQR